VPNYAAGVPEVADRIGRSEWAVRDLVRRGLIPHRRLIAGGRIEFDLDEIDRWLESRRVRPPEAASA
jgi:predicted DNA-binding transcriptional regulator AlpA